MIKYFIKENIYKIMINLLTSISVITLVFIMNQNIELSDKAIIAYNNLNPFIKFLINIIVPIKHDFIYIFLYLLIYITLINLIYLSSLNKKLKDLDLFKTIPQTLDKKLKQKNKALIFLITLPILVQYILTEIISFIEYKVWHYQILLFYLLQLIILYIVGIIFLEYKIVNKKRKTN